MSSRWFRARSERIQRYPAAASTASILTFATLLGCWANCQAQPGSNSMPVPIRVFTIYVQVSLPNGLSSSWSGCYPVLTVACRGQPLPMTQAGLNFPVCLKASTRSALSASLIRAWFRDTAQTNPSRTANGNLTVHLQLHDRSDHSRNPKPVSSESMRM